MNINEFINELNEEKRRHNKKIREIQKQVGIHKILKKNYQIKNKLEELDNKGSELQELFFEIINKISRKKKHSIGRHYTIREGSIYNYGQSEEVELTNLSDSEIFLDSLKDICKDKYKHKVETIKKELRRCPDSFNRHSLSKNYKVRKVENNTYIGYSPKKRYIYKTNAKNREAAINNIPYSCEKYEIHSLEEENMKIIFRYKDDIYDMIRESHNKVMSNVNTAEDIHNSLKDEFKELLVSDRL
jgi:hypothetical protein